MTFLALFYEKDEKEFTGKGLIRTFLFQVSGRIKNLLDPIYKN